MPKSVAFDVTLEGEIGSGLLKVKKRPPKLQVNNVFLCKIYIGPSILLIIMISISKDSDFVKIDQKSFFFHILFYS